MAELETTQDASDEQLQEGQAEEASQEESQATEERPANLDEDPRFRQWKSKMDRIVATERKERERLQQELEAHREKVDELSLKDAQPEERVNYYRNKVAQLEQEQRIQSQRQQQIAEMTEKADTLLNKLGLDRNSPGLDWSGDPMEDGFEKLALSAVEVASKKQGTSKQQVEAEVRKAKQEAIKETGAADVSTATKGGGPSLRAQYEKELAELRGSRNVRGFVALRHKYREKGLDV